MDQIVYIYNPIDSVHMHLEIFDPVLIINQWKLFIVTKFTSIYR